MPCSRQRASGLPEARAARSSVGRHDLDDGARPAEPGGELVAGRARGREEHAPACRRRSRREGLQQPLRAEVRRRLERDRGAGNEERKAAVVAGPTEATRRVSRRASGRARAGQPRAHRAHRVGAREDEPVVAVERFERRVERAGSSGGAISMSGHLDHGRAQRLRAAPRDRRPGSGWRVTRTRRPGSALMARLSTRRARGAPARRAPADRRPARGRARPDRSRGARRAAARDPSGPATKARELELAAGSRRGRRAARCSRRRAPPGTRAPPRPRARSARGRAARRAARTSASSSRHSSAIAPCPGAGTNGAGSRTSVDLARAAEPDEARPWPAGSRRSRPRAAGGGACPRCRAGPRAARSGRSAWTCARRRRLVVPTRAPAGSSARPPPAPRRARRAGRRAPGSRTSAQARRAAPSGTSFRLCTARSTSPASSASSISLRKAPLPPTVSSRRSCTRSPVVVMIVRARPRGRAPRGAPARARPARARARCRAVPMPKRGSQPEQPADEADLARRLAVACDAP